MEYGGGEGMVGQGRGRRFHACCEMNFIGSTRKARGIYGRSDEADEED